MRIETTTREIFTFDELSDDAKENARNEWREHGIGYDWWEDTYEDAKQCAEIIGIDIDDIFFSGFCSQGDGAMFTGSYSYKKGATLAIRAYTPQDSALHEIADQLQSIQKTAFYQLYASTVHRGHYYHEHSMDISVDRDSDNYQEITDDQHESVSDLLRDFASWIYARLNAEYEWLTSDESIDESLVINECEFDASGVMI